MTSWVTDPQYATPDGFFLEESLSVAESRIFFPSLSSMMATSLVLSASVLRPAMSTILTKGISILSATAVFSGI